MHKCFNNFLFVSFLTLGSSIPSIASDVHPEDWQSLVGSGESWQNFGDSLGQRAREMGQLTQQDRIEILAQPEVEEVVNVAQVARPVERDFLTAIYDFNPQMKPHLIGDLKNLFGPNLSMLCSSLRGKNLKFGRIIQQTKYGGRKTDICNKALEKYFNTNQNEFMLDELLATLDSKVLSELVDKRGKFSELQAKELISLATSFRHIEDPLGDRGVNVLGDYVCEYLIVNCFKKMTDSGTLLNDIWLSDGLYQLSQVYSHVFDFKKVRWQGRQNEGCQFVIGRHHFETNPVMLIAPVSSTNLLRTKLDLIKFAIIMNPDSPKPHLELVRHLIYGNDKHGYHIGRNHELLNMSRCHSTETLDKIERAVRNVDIEIFTPTLRVETYRWLNHEASLNKQEKNNQ